MNEKWKDVIGYEGLYEVSNLGHLRNKLTQKELHGGLRKGYIIVRLTKGGKTKNHSLHRLIALTWIPNPDNLPEVNHINEDKLDNRIENLEWCTVAYNRAYGTRNQRVGGNGAVRVRCVETGKEYPSITAAAADVGGNAPGICACLKGQYKTSHGYHWERVES